MGSYDSIGFDLTADDGKGMALYSPHDHNYGNHLQQAGGSHRTKLCAACPASVTPAGGPTTTELFGLTSRIDKIA